MGTLTVTHEPEHASAKPDKKSGLFGRFRANRAGVAPVERDTFPNPSGPSQAIRDPQPPRTATTALPPLHRDQSTNPDIVAIRMIRVLSQCLDEHWSSTRLQDELLKHSGELHRRSMREQEGGATIARRAQSAQQAAVDGARLLTELVAAKDEAERLGMKVEVDLKAKAQRVAHGIAAMTANAHAPQDPTTQFERITEDMPDPRVTLTVVPAVANGSPVHVPGDGAHPAIPEFDDEDEFEEADPGDRSLAERVAPPKRIPHATVIVAPVGPDGGPLHGKRLNPREVQLDGAWVFYGGAGGSGPVYRLVASVQVREDDTLITYVCGDTQTVKRDAKNPTVRVLTSSEASDLLGQYADEAASL